MKEKAYVITEEQLGIFYNLCKNEPNIPNMDAWIRSHPYNKEDILDDFVMWNDTREIFHLVQDYKRELRQRERK